LYRIIALARKYMDWIGILEAPILKIAINTCILNTYDYLFSKKLNNFIFAAITLTILAYKIGWKTANY